MTTRDSHLESCNEDDSHTIGSAIAENPMMDANFTTPCFAEAESSPIEV